LIEGFEVSPLPKRDEVLVAYVGRHEREGPRNADDPQPVHEYPKQKEHTDDCEDHEERGKKRESDETLR
jgi:hypothetical protein